MSENEQKVEGKGAEEKKANEIQADDKKRQANEEFKKHNYMEAIFLYTQAIELNPTNAIYYSNRSICRTKVENFGLALTDAEKAIELDPEYVKGYYRKATAYYALAKYKDARKAYSQVLKRKPKDASAKKKRNECRKLIREAALAEAIGHEDEKKQSESVDLSMMIVDSSYTGPSIEDNVITKKFVDELIEHYKAEKNLHPKYVYQILLQLIEYFTTQPTLQEIPVQKGEHFTVCGDVHGQFYDLLNIWEINGMPSEENPYLFNGDFVDRGSFSLEIMMTFFSMKLLYPNHFYMHRGNHECKTMNQIYGFMGEVHAKVNAGSSFAIFQEVFNLLPLCSIIGGKVFVTHGGLFQEDNVTIDQIKKVDRVRQPPDSGLMCELLWSDPQPQTGRAPSKRGVGLAFGPDVTANFLETNDLELVVRSHEVKMGGYEISHNGKLVTVFSAPNYCDTMGNKGAFIKFDDKMKPTYTAFDSVPHPKVRPMAYASQQFQMYA